MNRGALVAVSVALAFAGGWLLVRGAQHRPSPQAREDPDGGWVEGLPGSFAVRPGAAPASDGLGAIGYAPGSEPPPPRTGVLLREDGAPGPGWTLVCHGDAAAAELLDAAGSVVHRWALPYEALPDAPPLEGDHQRPWRAVELLEDGDLLALHGGRALLRVGPDSSLRWVRYGRFHHDVLRQDDGHALVLSRRERTVPAVHPDVAVVDDLLVRFDLATGASLSELSLWDALLASDHAPLLERLTVRTGDVMHANGLALPDADWCAALGVADVEAGDVLVSMRDLDLVAAVDLDRGRVAWLTHGPKRSPWRGLHDPTPYVDEGGQARLLVFDNLGGPAGTSRILDLRLPEASIAWSYEGTPPTAFHSLFCGTVQRLPTGRLLVAESLAGRVHELDPVARQPVWTWASPHLVGEGGRYVAAVFEATRVPGPLPWLGR